MQVCAMAPRCRAARFIVWGLAALLAMLAAAPAEAHVHWTRTNAYDERLLALYHFDDHGGAAGSLLRVANGLAAGLHLSVGPTSGLSMQAVHDTPATIFEPHALQLRSAQTADSTDTLAHLDGDLTLEAWFKWDTDLTSQSVQFGLRSGAKLTIVRDVDQPANDRFGLSFTHGDYASAPGFVSWAAVGEEEASLGEWRHVAVTIHSTGLVYNATSGHDIYTTDSLARFYLNGHAVGTAPHTVELAGKQVHDASRVRIQSQSGAIKLDEVAIWSHDWSENGAVVNPFADGRGDGTPSAARGWLGYE